MKYLFAFTGLTLLESLVREKKEKGSAEYRAKVLQADPEIETDPRMGVPGLTDDEEEEGKGEREGEAEAGNEKGRETTQQNNRGR